MKPLLWYLIEAALLANTRPSQCQSLFEGLNNGIATGGVSCLYSDTVEDVLYMSGIFRLADDTINCPGIMMWDGEYYHPMGCGFGWNCTSPFPGPGGGVDFPYAITLWNDEIYAGGYFEIADGDTVNNIARWDGSAWHPLGRGINGPVHGLRGYADGLYVTGWFDMVDDTIAANGLARWDGTQWHRVHDIPKFDGTDVNFINDVAIYEGELYVGGNFQDTLGGERRDIAKFDGTQWVGIVDGGLLGTYSTVQELEVHGGLLYVMGSFSNGPPYGVPSNPGTGIVAWDGTDWIDIGGGTAGAGNASVLRAEFIGDTIIALGHFDRIGGVPTSGLAKWDGTRWCSLVPENYFYPGCVALAIYEDAIHIGGSFVVAGPDSINRVAKWIGGSYVDSCGFGVGVAEHLAPGADHQLHFEPATGILQLFPAGQFRSSTLEIFDPMGRLLLTTNISREHCVNVAALSSGVYIVRLLSSNIPTMVGRFVKE